MEGPRAPLDSEFASVVEFLDSNLRPNETWSITNEYPVAFSEANRNNIRIISANEKILSHAVVRPMIIKSPVGLFKIAGVGSVVTSSEHRGQGLSSKIITSCVESAKAHGCEFAILWTNLYDFYRKMDFELAGTEMNAIIDRDLPSSENSLQFLETKQIAAEALHRLFTQHTVTTLRTVEETARYLQIPNSRIYSAWDASGALRAYAIEGKGADLDGYVHEWGGDVPALMQLFGYIRSRQKRTIHVIIPKHSQNLLRELERAGIKINIGYLGMIKILNFESLFTKIKRYARSIGVADLVLTVNDGKYYIGAGQNVFVTDSPRDVVKLLFGPLKASEIYDFGKETSQVMERVLPINMWLWGWDSI